MREWMGLIAIVGALGAANYARGNGATSQHIAADLDSVFETFSQSYGEDEEGIAHFGPATRIPYRVDITRVPGTSLDIVLALDGVRAWEVHYDFAADGSGTRVTGEVEIHQEALERKFAGTPAAEMVDVSDVVHEFGLEGELQRAKLQIEAGQPLGISGPTLFDAEWVPHTQAAQPS